MKKSDTENILAATLLTIVIGGIVGVGLWLMGRTPKTRQISAALGPRTESVTVDETEAQTLNVE